MRMTTGLLATLLLAMACGDEPADVTGTFTVSVANRENGCGFDNWEEGKVAIGIPVNVRQVDSAVLAEIGGLTGWFLDLVVGGHILTGEVSGPSLTLAFQGSKSIALGDCLAVVIAHIDADVDGDFIEGTIDYTLIGNDIPECAAKAGCQTTQAFNGSRLPE